ncbi:hypothetical protein K2P56_03700 [Patescibacteria group bacterium]|nr:hypothetical protein [Patescibacteria group bacterium]
MSRSVEAVGAQIFQSIPVETAGTIKDAQKALKNQNLAGAWAFNFIQHQFRFGQIPKPPELADFDDGHRHHLLGVKPPVSFHATSKGFEFLTHDSRDVWDSERDRAVVYAPYTGDV